MASKHGTIGIVPMGAVDDAVLHIIGANLQAIFDVPVDLLPGKPTPAFAYSSHRKQYHAALIMNKLLHSRRAHPRLLAVLDLDLFIPVLTHVFGEAQLGGRSAVVSLYRLRERVDGRRVGLETFYQRAVKVAVHELAHTLDLVHCDHECVMRFSSLCE
jgi:archaemetzincin